MFAKSWATPASPVGPTEKIPQWIERKNREPHVEIRKISLKEISVWYYSEKKCVLRNEKGTFFQATGFRAYENGELGAIRQIRAAFAFPFLGGNDFRYNAALDGGALLDYGVSAASGCETAGLD